jgi:Four helix bundle sensory module for signal transduction
MFRKELFILCSLIVAIFAGVAIVSSLMARALQHESQMVALTTLPGLVNAGGAVNRMNDNWENIRLLTEMSSAEARANLMQRIHENSTEDLWKEYRKSIFDRPDKILFEQTQRSRTNCRVLVHQYYDLVTAQKLNEARQFLKAKVQPAFEQYKSNATSLFNLNTEMGEKRAQHIIQLTRWLPLVAGFFCVLIFSIGVFIGLKGAFGSLAFASQPRKHPKNAQPPHSRG